MRRRITSFSFPVFMTLLIVGCAGGIAGGMSTFIVALLSAFCIAACSSSTPGGGGAEDAVEETVTDTSTEPGTDDGCDGNWEECCVDGVATQCCCPKNTACNYIWSFQVCPDGSAVCSLDQCTEPGLDTKTEPDTAPDTKTEPDTAPDTKTEPDTAPDTVTDTGTECDGNWEACCVDDVVTECCCPENADCNYGWNLKTCPDGTLVCGEAPCDEPPTPDTIEPETSGDTAGCDGEWQTCCQDGAVGECCCPKGAACNFGWGLKTCPDGTQVCTETPCEKPPPPDIKDATSVDAGCDGTWEACCIDGKVSQCCCPVGAACNFGWYTDCGDGTCVFPAQDCKPKS